MPTACWQVFTHLLPGKLCVYSSEVSMITIALRSMFLCLLSFSTSGSAWQNPAQTADQLFKDGEFSKAKRAYLGVLKNDRKSLHAMLRLGQIALLSNRLFEAERLFNKVLVAEPANKDGKRFLAEVFVREHKFALAAQIYRELDSSSKAAQMESLAHTIPYQTAKHFHEARIPFLLTDPLPVIQAQINGGKALNFLIDTGGPDVIIDDGVAQSLGIATFGSTTGTFAGGKKSSLMRGQLEALTMGNLTVQNIPVLIQNTRRYSGIFQGKPIDGIIGTVFLSQFLSTIDYANSELILRPRSAKLKGIKDSVALPMWLAQDHLILARGTVNNSPSTLMLVDTGLAGIGITAPKAFLDLAGVHIAEKKVEGIGGGGTVQAQPFTADHVSLGPVSRNNIQGVFGVFPASLEDVDGIRVGALISHQFFLRSSLTLDFERMQIRLVEHY
jgi:predicted aspartyl protease